MGFFFLLVLVPGCGGPMFSWQPVNWPYPAPAPESTILSDPIQTCHCDALLESLPVIVFVQFKPILTMMPIPFSPRCRAYCLSSGPQHYLHWQCIILRTMYAPLELICRRHKMECKHTFNNGKTWRVTLIFFKVWRTNRTFAKKNTLNTFTARQPEGTFD